MRHFAKQLDADRLSRGDLRGTLAILCTLAALVVLSSLPALAQDLPSFGLDGIMQNGITQDGITQDGITQDGITQDGIIQDDPISALSFLADTSDAGLRVERARLDLARSELRSVSGWRRWRPAADFFVSMSTRGLAFPSISSQGYDPAYAAIARWPGDTWGVTLSWSIDQLLDRRPVNRARNAVDVAEARIDVYQARREQSDARERQRAIARAERETLRLQREAEQTRRATLVATQLRIEADFLARRLDAQRELLRLAQLKYDQGEVEYEALARTRLAVLSAEHACATNAARLATLEASGDPTLALHTGPRLSPEAPDDLPPAPSP